VSNETPEGGGHFAKHLQREGEGGFSSGNEEAVREGKRKKEETEKSSMPKGDPKKLTALTPGRRGKKEKGEGGEKT